MISYNLLLADDDMDDCTLFREALQELPLDVTLTTVNDGDELMHLLGRSAQLPDVLFLDLNMPRKTGFECLMELKQHTTLKNIPVVIYSTSLNHDVVNTLYELGAHCYVRKPGSYLTLKKVIHETLKIMGQAKPHKDKFVIQV